MKINFIAAAALFLSCHIASGEGLDGLIQVGKSMEAGQKALAAETARYKAVKSAVESGAVKPGLSADEARQTYGEPSTSLKQEDGTVKWVYKPGYGDYFSGTKVYLFFGQDAVLKDAKIVTQEKKNK